VAKRYATTAQDGEDGDEDVLSDTSIKEYMGDEDVMI
jgi:hypothetical protein